MSLIDSQRDANGTLAQTPSEAQAATPRRTRRRRSRNPIASYTRWLHTRWPAGTVEKLPRVNEDFSTSVPGLYIVGDLTGIPLLKFSSDSGARAVRTILATSPSQPRSQDRGSLDLVIIGAGVSGMAAALEARKANLRFEIIEASEPFATIVNFPKGKPIYTYPTDLKPAGDLQFREQVHPKEQLLDDLRRETIDNGIVPKSGRAERIVRGGDALEVVLADGRPSLVARNVIIAIGRSGNFRKLNVPGEDLGKVFNRLHDPKEFAGKDLLVVGGGDSALETAIALAECGGRVTLSYRKPEFSRPKPDNIEKLNALITDPMADVQVERPASERVTTAVGDYMGVHRGGGGSIQLMLGSQVKRIDQTGVEITNSDGNDITLRNDAVFTMIGREPPLDFLRRSGVRIYGDRGALWWITLLAFLVFCVWMYHWKKSGVTISGIAPVDRVLNVGNWWHDRGWFPYDLAASLKSLGGAWANPKNPLGTLRISFGEAGFWYSLAYCACVVGFGIDRVRRKPTPYVKKQTLVLALFQVIPLFLLPYILFPWLGHNGAFDAGMGKWFADTFFPAASYTEHGHGREYWRAFGFILAWPLFIWNVFTSQPLWGWLILSFIQTFIAIPLIIYFWGKGAYCGWICSCGALAETLGDRHRHKMPHGPFWNRFNMLGQAFLLFAFVLLITRALGWIWPGSVFGTSYDYLLSKIPVINYVWFVDLLWAGILGVGLYFWFSGRVWCRFACPLAALMHIYARFSRFRILADKKKCISCNVCTSVCHQGIDVMNFANKGIPMDDPECVRCSACVQSCPTGVLEFGQVNRRTDEIIKKDPAWLAASPVLMREIGVNGKKVPV
jgi:thioredoxin reductase/ferredoxin